MRQGLWALAACALIWASPARAQTAPAPTKDLPVVVAGVPVTLAQARARAGSRASDFEVREMYTDLVQAHFIAAEAALRGSAPRRTTSGATSSPRRRAGAARSRGASS